MGKWEDYKRGGGQKSGQDENRVCTGQRTKECEQ